MGTVNLGPQPTSLGLMKTLRAAGFKGWAEAALAAHNREVNLRAALQEIADNKHGFHRPAAAIARAALNGDPLPEWDR